VTGAAGLSRRWASRRGREKARQESGSAGGVGPAVRRRTEPEGAALCADPREGASRGWAFKVQAGRSDSSARSPSLWEKRGKGSRKARHPSRLGKVWLWPGR